MPSADVVMFKARLRALEEKQNRAMRPLRVMETIATLCALPLLLLLLTSATFASIPGLGEEPARALSALLAAITLLVLALWLRETMDSHSRSL
jgi:hypothetical protein